MNKKEICKANRQKAIERMQASPEYKEAQIEIEKYNAGVEANGWNHLETNRHYWNAKKLLKQARKYLRAE